MHTPARASVVRRLAAYTGERFPLPAYLPMILLAAFAALGFSRVARGVAGFPGWAAYATAAFTLLAAFFALRVADEHKDAAVDRLTRPELPVPRGLVTLRELRIAAAVLGALAIFANLLLAPVLLAPLAVAAIWLALMTREFFAREWLRRQPALYLVSHMVIMPLLLLYATAVDWLAAGDGMPGAVWLLLAASYAAGLVLEVGRKIRAPEDERPGVDTYTATWGQQRALTVWLVSLVVSAALIAAAGFAVAAWWGPLLAPLAALGASTAALRFVGDTPPRGAGRAIEGASAAWILAAYALLALPWLERAFR